MALLKVIRSRSKFSKYKRIPSDAARFTLSRIASPGVTGMGQRQMGDGSGPKPGIQILPVDK
jgi:hypothetical protein